MAATESTQGVCIALAGSVDAGKCFAPGTWIMKYNGRLEKVENIVIGDTIMGDDSTMRTVKSIHTGMSQLYEIKPLYGKAYTVNGEHILCLLNSSDKTIIINGTSYLPKSVIEISVNNYDMIDKKIKPYLTWYKTSVIFNNTDQEEDPYNFGIHINEKVCIPDSLKFSSIYSRTMLLNGIYDMSDKIDSVYAIRLNNKHKQLIKDVKFVINSLGYTISEKIKHETYTNMNLIIPHIGVVFGIKRNGFGKYYGFELDGNGRFLLGDCSVAHNSSFIGVIMSGELDDGNGSARNKVAKHRHEIETGKTSDISVKNFQINGRYLTMIDLCGHEKYLKTTLFGITGHFPDYGVVIVAANRGILPMTWEHMKIFTCLRIPFIIVITRMDLVVNNEQIYEDVVKGIKRAVGNRAVFINSNKELSLEKDALTIAEKDSKEKLTKIANSIKSNYTVIPAIGVSNKSGYFIDSVKHLLSQLTPRNIWRTFDTTTKGTIFYIDDKFTPGGVGLVVSGIVKGNSIEVGSKMLIGPYGKQFVPIRVWSIHDNNKNVITSLGDKERGCLAFRVTDKKLEFTKDCIRKGCVVISQDGPLNNLCFQFNADIEVLNHSTTISQKYSPVIHCGIVSQTARIILDDGQVLKMKDKASVKFRFVKNPEFLEVGSTFFFREGTTRGVGKITEVLSLSQDGNPNPAGLSKRNFRRRFRQAAKRGTQSKSSKQQIVVL